MITVAFVSPWATTSSTHGSPTKCAVSAAGSVAVAITSRSRKVSRRRRVLPASETSIAAGCARSASTTSRTTGSPLPSRPRRRARCRPGPRRAPSGSSPRSSAPMPESVRSCSPSAAAFSSASVVTPSSRQIRAAVFGPSPGSRMNDDDLAGNLGAPLRERLHVARLDDLDDLRLDRLADVRAAPSPCPRARARRPTRPCRGSAPRRAGRRRRETTARRGSRTGRRAGRAGPRDRRCEGAPRPCPDHRAARDGQDWPMRAMVCLPTYNERDNLEPMVRALGEQIDTARDRVLVIDDNSPDGTGEIADAARGRASLGRGAAPRRQGGARARRTSPGSDRALADGRRARARDRLRLLPRPEGRASPDRHLRGGRRSRARLPLGRRRRHRQLGPRPHVRLARRQLLRPHDPRRRRPRPDGRLQVLSPRRPRDDRPRRDRRQGLRLPDRDDLPRAARRASGSSRSRSRSSTGASASRRWTARSSSRRCSRCRCCATARSAAGCRRLAPTLLAWTRSPTRRSPTRCSAARSR